MKQKFLLIIGCQIIVVAHGVSHWSLVSGIMQENGDRLRYIFGYILALEVKDINVIIRSKKMGITKRSSL